MRSVADDLREESHRRLGRLSPAERIALALALGDADAEYLAAARGLSLEEARRVIARERQTGRPPSRCTWQ